MHVPRDLHFEFLDRLDTRPGESRGAKAGRLIAFYADTMARLPATTAVGDAYQFWKTAFGSWVARSAPTVRASPLRDVYAEAEAQAATRPPRRSQGWRN